MTFLVVKQPIVLTIEGQGFWYVPLTLNFYRHVTETVGYGVAFRHGAAFPAQVALKPEGLSKVPYALVIISELFTQETGDINQIFISGAKEYPHRISMGLLKLEIGELAYQYLLLHYFAPSSIALIADDYRSLAGNRSGFRARLEERGILPGPASFINFIMECSAAAKDQALKSGASGRT